MTVKELIERLNTANPDSEVMMIVPWGHPTFVEDAHVAPDGVILSGTLQDDIAGMPYV